MNTLAYHKVPHNIGFKGDYMDVEVIIASSDS